MRVVAVLALSMAAACSTPPDSPDAGPFDGGPIDAATDAPIPCSTAADCKSLASVCATPVCKAGVCGIEPMNDFGSCDDDNFCTDDDSCHDGVCVGSTQHFCPPPADGCRIGVCDETSKSCKSVAGNEGASCPAVDLCHQPGTCTSGQCLEGGPADCSVFNTSCTLGACTLPGGCAAKPINEGLACDDGKNSACSYGHCSSGLCLSMATNENGPCDDGLFCTVNDRCAGGLCVADPNPCAPPGGCFTATCDEGTKSCMPTSLPDGTPCDDQNACTTGTSCLAGVCTLGAPTNEGLPCDDGSSCTMGEACSAGLCTGGVGPVVYLSDDFADNAKGWSLGPEWQIGSTKVSMGGAFGADPAKDHGPTADNGVAGVVLGGNASTMVHPFSYLESPPFDATGAAPVILGYYRWLNSDRAPFMHDTVDVWDGASWVTVWASGGSPTQDSPPSGAGWTYMTHDVTAYRNATMRVRFGFDIAMAGAFDVGSWNVDDVLVASQACP